MSKHVKKYLIIVLLCLFTCNKALTDCISLCTQFKFDEAQKLNQQYHSGLFKAIIGYYKQIKVEQDQQLHDALYDAHGIIRVAYNDPLYKQYKHAVQEASGRNKSNINDNFLIRHQIKTTMQQKWGIPDSAPSYVHDALYEIMGDDCSALSDVTLLAGRIHEIIAAAPAERQAELIKAFYAQNGVLKEYAQHDPGVQKIKMHASILNIESADVRKELNELVGSRIKNPQDAPSINKAIDALDLKFNEAPQQQKPSVTPQGGGEPAPGAPAPDPDPNENKHKKSINNNFANQTKEQLLKSQQSYDKLLEEHIEKLEKYKNNPDLYDHKNLLKNITQEIREKRIEGRIKQLQKQMDNHRNTLAEINELLKMK